MTPRHYGSFREYAEAAAEADCELAPAKRETLLMNFVQRREFATPIEPEPGGMARAIQELTRYIAGMGIDVESVRFEVTAR